MRPSATRRVRLTEAGSGYLANARRILGEIDEAEQSLAGAHGDLIGRVTVTAPVMFGRLHVGPHMLAFRAENPGIQFDLRLLDRVADLLEEGIDVAIRIAHLPSSSATAIRVGSVRRVLCASPAYLARHGTPRTLADAAKHDAITLGNAWEFAEDGKKKTLAQPKPRFLTNSIENAIEAALAGMGLVQLLSYQVSGLIAAGRLRRVLSSLEPEPCPFISCILKAEPPRAGSVPSSTISPSDCAAIPRSRARSDRRGRQQRLRRPRSLELLVGALKGIAVEIAFCVTGNARHRVGLQARRAIGILPEPVFLPALLHLGVRIVVCQP